MQSSNTTINKVSVSNVRTGIRDAGKDNIITNTIIRDFSFMGIEHQSGSSNGTVSESVIQNGYGPSTTAGISSLGSSHSIVNTRIHDISGVGINLPGTPPVIGKHLIESVAIRNVSWRGIMLMQPDVTIRDSVIEGGTNKVEGDPFAALATTGIMIAGGASGLITNNTITNNAVGLYMFYVGAEPNKIFHNNFYNNSVTNLFDHYVSSPIELSYNGEGNFWGYTAPPCFRHDNPFVTDSYPYCRKDSWKLTATVQPPINTDGSSIFKANRGVIPTKFMPIKAGVSTCDLPAATIIVSRQSDASWLSINEQEYIMPADNGSNFRITDCQYHYNLAAKSLGPGTYRVSILVDGRSVGSARFMLR